MSEQQAERTVRADEITEEQAPVSGTRCRGCGASSRRCKDLWTIRHGAAYCPECAAAPKE